MATSEAYKRGFRRGVEAARSLAFERKIVCENAADRYSKEYPTNDYWQKSERCAAREATYIWEELSKLKAYGVGGTMERDMSFEQEVLDNDPAVRRFHVIKAALVTAGFAPKMHDEKCICLCCIEGGVDAAIKAAATN